MEYDTPSPWVLSWILLGLILILLLAGYGIPVPRIVRLEKERTKAEGKAFMRVGITIYSLFAITVGVVANALLFLRGAAWYYYPIAWLLFGGCVGFVYIYYKYTYR